MPQEYRVSAVSVALAFLLLFLAIPSLAIAEDEFRESKKLKTIERQLERAREEAGEHEGGEPLSNHGGEFLVESGGRKRVIA